MGNTSTTPKIIITGHETLEEIYFLIRVGSWHPEHLEQYIQAREMQGYDNGYYDGQAQDTGEAEYLRGFDDGYEKGMIEGEQAGYDEGYNDGVREER